MEKKNSNHHRQQKPFHPHQHHRRVNRGGGGGDGNEYKTSYKSNNKNKNNNTERPFKRETRGSNNKSNIIISSSSSTTSTITSSSNNSNSNNDNNLNNDNDNTSIDRFRNKSSVYDLCQRIRNCKTLMEVYCLYRSESISMKPCHISFYWNQISRLISISNSNKSSYSPMGSFSCLQRLKRNPTLLKPLVGKTIFHNSELDTRSLAVTAHALAKISHKTRKPIVDSDKLWELLEKNIIEKATSTKDNFSSQECANIVWSFAKEFGGRQQHRGKTTSSNYNPALLFDAMIDQLTPKLHLCNAQDIANTVWAFATADHPAPALFDAMIPTAMEQLDKFDSQNLANTVWAYATVRHPASQLFDAVAAALTETATTNGVTDNGSGNKLDTFNSQAIANTVWAFASVGHYTPKTKLFLDALVISALRKLHFFNSQEMAITVWGYATLDHSSPKLFDAVSQLAIQKIPTFNSQGIANTVWAYATMGHPASELFYAVSQLIIQRIDIYNSQAIFANAGRGGYPVEYLPPELLNAASSLSISSSSNKSDIFNSQAIANTVWAFATVGHTNPHLFDSISQLALMKLDSFNSQEIANTVWAYATVHHPAPALFFAISQSPLPKLNTFNSQELANTLWAFATLSHPAPEFFDAVSNLAVSKLNTFNSQELANTIWAYATVYHYYVNPHFTNGILYEAIQKVESLESEQIVNILWSIVVLNSVDTEAVAPLFSEVAKRYHLAQNNFRLSREALSQLHQASMWYSEEHHCKESLLPKELRDLCFNHFSSSENLPSKLQRDVVQTFKSLPSYLGVSIIEEESRCERTGYSIDVLISINQQQLAVEIDGPCHFVGYSPNGATMLKQRQLFSLGNTPLLSVPYWEWDMLNSKNPNTINHNNWNNKSNNDHYHNYNGEIKRKKSYLQQRLQQASFL